MADSKVTTVYVQQEQHPGGWVDHAETTDAQTALSRYKVFATGSPPATRLIERTEKVIAEHPTKKKAR